MSIVTAKKSRRDGQAGARRGISPTFSPFLALDSDQNPAGLFGVIFQNKKMC